MIDGEKLKYLCCPYDHGTLSQRRTRKSGDANSDYLQCSSCGRSYPVEADIARFVTKDVNDLSELQKSEMEVRDKQYRMPPTNGVNAWDLPEIDAVRAALGKYRAVSILDAGCGAGRVNHAIRNAEGFLGIDFAWEGLTRFQNPAGTTTELAQGDITRMPVRDKVFDLALCCSVLSHLPTLELRSQLLRELARVLKPGGRLILTAMHYSFRYRRRQIPQEAVEDGSFYHRFEVDELRNLLSESFKIDSLHGYWIYLPKTYRLFVALGKKRVYSDRILRSLPLSLKYGKYLLAGCSPKS